jgi:hypothetical protein
MIACSTCSFDSLELAPVLLEFEPALQGVTAATLVDLLEMEESLLAARLLAPDPPALGSLLPNLDGFLRIPAPSTSLRVSSLLMGRSLAGAVAPAELLPEGEGVFKEEDIISSALARTTLSDSDSSAIAAGAHSSHAGLSGGKALLDLRL